jgi:uncharacterized C2H2 Zn-finger protein
MQERKGEQLGGSNLSVNHSQSRFQGAPLRLGINILMDAASLVRFHHFADLVLGVLKLSSSTTSPQLTLQCTKCDECDRSFSSQQALGQHLNSPSHVFECNDCDRSFRSQQSLEQHLNPPSHNFEMRSVL